MARRLKVLACLLPVVLAAVGVGAYQLTMSAWNQVVDYRSPCAFTLAPVPPASAPLTGRVVIAVVDGLRSDTSLDIPFLSALRRQGAAVTLVTGQPSLSLPAQAVFGTGALQEANGVTTNWYDGPCALDNIFAAARRAGLKTAVVSDGGWQQLYGEFIDDSRVIEYSDAADDQALAAGLTLLEGPAALMVVHFLSLDHVGHERGASSAQYADTAAAIDRRLESLASAMDFSRETLIVVSDHGHVAAGGHGGWEREVVEAPAVLAGCGTKPLADRPASQADLAPTVAALLGVSYPAQATGTPLFDALAFSDEQRAAAAAGLARSRLPFSAAYVNDYSRRPGSAPDEETPATRALWEDSRTQLDEVARAQGTNDFGAAYTAALALDEGLRQARLDARAAAVSAGRRSRAVGALAVILLPLGGLWALRRRRLLLPAAAGAAAYFALYYALFLTHGYRFSLSAFNSEELVEAFFMGRLAEAALAAAVAALVAGIVSGWREKRLAVGLRGERGAAGGAWAGAAAGALGVGLALYLLVAQGASYYWLYGITVKRLLPDLMLGFKFYLDLLQVTAVGVAALASPLLGAIAWVAIRSRPRD